MKIREDAAKVRRVLDFMRRLRHVQGHLAGKAFVPQEWQINQIIRPIFGQVDENGNRVVKKGLVWVPKKNGKSTLSAAIALYLLMWDGEAGAEVASAAADRQQAGIVYEMARMMCERAHSSISDKVVYGSKEIRHTPSQSRYYVVSSEVKGRHGPNLHGLIFDEIHTQPNRDLWDTLTPGGIARKQSLVMGLSTAGVDRETLGWEQYDYSRRIVAGEIENPAYHAVVYAAPEGADWQSEDVWQAVNPGIGVSVQIEALRALYDEAKGIPTQQAAFRRLHLNQWIQDAQTWLDMEAWDKCAGFSDEPEAGDVCYGGLDLSSVRDLTAWVLVFPQLRGDTWTLRVKATAWCPERKLHDPANQYAPQYRQWADMGLLRTVPGDAIEYGPIREQVQADAEKYFLAGANMDRLFQGHQVMVDLQQSGVLIFPMGQGYLSMAAPTKIAERMIMRREIDHGGDPLLRWQAQNTCVSMDAAGNLKPDKKAARLPIDSVVALIMAVQRWSLTRDYTDRGTDLADDFISYI